MDREHSIPSDTANPSLDEGFGSRSEGLGVTEARGNWMYGFEVGDMVWGKVKSHPWWPGHIFNEAFASSSVRRTKREGHVLVAFFGDSSYGWFDPAELVPFDLHYAEKSRQTTSRNFVKAVEEAVDEASRRSALGLSCCCRNPSNFRPTTVPGYFVIDVAGYEPGGVYSSKQIRKARDDFVECDVLSFVKELAVRPQDSEQGSIDLMRRTATVLALRKAMFEEYDVTYAEAFGVQPVLPSNATQGVPDQREKVPFRVAPLSGPLVIAEALGERKASTSKAVVRAKDPSAKKNKYLLKRREEATPPSAAGAKQRPHLLSPSAGQLSPPSARHFPRVGAPNVHRISHVPADVVVAAADGSDEVELGNYVLQKRTPEKQQSILTKQEVDKVPVADFRDLSPERQDRAAEARRLKAEQPPGEGEMAISATVKVGSGGDDSSLHYEHRSAVDAKEAMGLKAPRVLADAEVKPRFPQPAADQVKDVEQSAGSTGIADASAMDVDSPQQRINQIKISNDVAKKEKARKHSREEELDGEKKKKRKKVKEGGRETSTDHASLKHRKSGESLNLSAGKSIGIGLAQSDKSLAERETKADAASNSATPADSAMQRLPKLDLASQSLDLPAILDDLSALALDPFYGAERNAVVVVRHVLLRFRSLVYEKALPFPPTGDHETSEPRVAKVRPARPLHESDREIAGVVKEGEAREPTKLHKAALTPIVKPDDPTRVGRKRMPSDRQEEKLAKRLKNLEKVKALTLEKKAGLANRTTDALQPRPEQKDGGSTSAAQAKLPKPADSVKKPEAAAPSRVAIPTYLVMKFPQRTTLPSISSLKARFARFGPLDLAGTRVFWKSYTCRVLFKHKSDAQAACTYAQSNEIFGQVKVNYFVREFDEGPSEPVRARPEDTTQFRPSGSGDSAADVKPSVLKHQSLYPGQPKSILKKPSGEEAAPAGSGGGAPKEAPRVKFMLGRENGRDELPVAASSSNNGGSNGGGILPAPAPLLDVNRKPPKSVSFLPPLQPPLQPPLRPFDMHALPLPPSPTPRGGLQFSRAPPPPPPPPHQARYGEMEARESGGVDISHQMLSLLTRCRDVVANVKSVLGYVPYHPL